MRKTDKDVKKRKAYYGFAKNYPGRVGSSGYVIGESRTLQKREAIRRVLIAVILLALFAVGFIATSVFLDISEKEIVPEVVQDVSEPQNSTQNAQ